MDYVITTEDLDIANNVSSTYLNGLILNNDLSQIGQINGNIIDLNLTIDAESSVRRIGGISIHPDDNYNLNENSKIWTDKIIQLNIGLKTNNMSDYKYYCIGTLVITDGNFSYDATNNRLTINLSDMFCTLDGTINGDVGAWTFEIGYGWIMSTVMKSLINQFTNIKKYTIEEMGMYYGIDYYINLFKEQFAVDEILQDIFYSAAKDAREYSSDTVLPDSDNIRSNSVMSALETVYDEYILNSLGNTANTQMSITFEDIKSGWEITGSEPPVGGYIYYYLYNCPSLTSKIGTNNVFLYDKFGMAQYVKIENLTYWDGIIGNPTIDYTCVNIGYDTAIRGEDDTYIYLPESDISSKSTTLYFREEYTSTVAYQKLVDAFKYLIEVPYTISISTGSTLSALMEELRDIYPAWDLFFDVYGELICQKIPTGQGDLPVLDENMMDNFLLSESSEERSFSYTDIRNVVQVFGKEFNVNNFSDDCTYSSTTHIFTALLDGLTAYTDGFSICVKFPSDYTIGDKLKLNDLNEYDLYNPATNEILSNGDIKAGYYVLRYSSLERWYLQGQYRAMAVAKLVSYEPDDSDKLADVEKYNCNNITYQVNPDSPYTVEKLGERKISYSGSDTEGVTSDAVAKSTAEYNLWKHARMTDSITINIKPILFLDVNQKIRYRLQKTGEVYDYITKQISFNYSPTDFTMTVMAIRYYDLYPAIVTI